MKFDRAYVSVEKDEDGVYLIELTVDGHEMDIAYTQDENQKNRIVERFE